MEFPKVGCHCDGVLLFAVAVTGSNQTHRITIKEEEEEEGVEEQEEEQEEQKKVRRRRRVKRRSSRSKARRMEAGRVSAGQCRSITGLLVKKDKKSK